MKFLNCLGLSDIKFVEKNDRSAKCKQSKEEIKRGEPVWILTSYRQPQKFKRSHIQVPVAKKVKIEYAFHRFLLPHKQFYKILVSKADVAKSKSLNDMVIIQMQEWITKSLKYLKKLLPATHKHILEQLVYKLEEKSEVESASQENETSNQKHVGLQSIFSPSSLSRKNQKKFKDFNLRSIIFLLRYFGKNWDFASCFTLERADLRKLAKFLQEVDLTKPLENLETEIEIWYKENLKPEKVVYKSSYSDGELDEV